MRGGSDTLQSGITVKKVISYAVLILCIPAVIVLGNVVFKDKQYAFVSLAVALLSCIPFFLSFEKREQNTTKLILIAVMTALSVVGRLLFYVVPGFKPVTAMVIITAMYFGSEAGFMTGALTAVISNFYFGQGPWTPFQMFTWGLIGLLAGLMAERLKKSKITLSVFGVVAGIIFSLLMDMWTVLWWDGTFNFTRYGVALISSFGYTVLYAVSNVIFLLILAKPIGTKLERIKDKYGI